MVISPPYSLSAGGAAVNFSFVAVARFDRSHLVNAQTVEVDFTLQVPRFCRTYSSNRVKRHGHFGFYDATSDRPRVVLSVLKKPCIGVRKRSGSPGGPAVPTGRQHGASDRPALSAALECSVPQRPVCTNGCDVEVLGE